MLYSAQTIVHQGFPDNSRFEVTWVLPGQLNPDGQDDMSQTEPNQAPITLRNVAEAAGVSVSTASRALTGQARQYRISASTEKAVQEIASELGFQASQVARSLRLKRSGLIGVIVPDISNPFFSAIARAVSLGVEAEGFSVLLGDSREQTEIEERLAHQLRARQVEALLVCPVGIESSHLVELDRLGLPVIVADRVFEDIDLPSVTTDNVPAARGVANQLFEAGHKKIGVLMGVPDSQPAIRRLQGLRDAGHAAGITVDPSFIAGDAFTEQSGYDATKQLLQRHPEITGLFSMCTPSAIGSMRALAELDISVPGEMSIVAFDDHPFSDLMKCPLTVAVQNIEDLGKRATEVLLGRLRNKPSVTRQQKHQVAINNPLIKVPTRLLRRASVVPPRH